MQLVSAISSAIQFPVKSFPYFSLPFNSQKMSCCGGNCGCGSGCKCGSGCGGCGMYPEMGFAEKTTTETIITGVAPVKADSEGSEMSFGAECGCKCGSSCTCDPCNCK